VLQHQIYGPSSLFCQRVWLEVALNMRQQLMSEDYNQLSLLHRYTTRCLAITRSGSVGEYGKLNQPSWAHYNVAILTYLSFVI